VFLLRRAWLPPQPERLLVVVHGFGEHSGRYEEFGAWFARRGCAVHAYDQRGHGRSGGRRGHVARFRDYLDDLDTFLELTRGEHPELICHLVGHSMGGLVTLLAASRGESRVASLVTSGALLEPPAHVPRIKVSLVRALRRLLPRLAMSADIDPDQLSRDPAVARRYQDDPLVLTRMTTSLAVEMLGAMEAAKVDSQRLRVPTLLLHGEADRLCPPSGSEELFARLSREDLPGSGLQVFPDLRHELFNEPEREQIFAQMFDWMCDREPDPNMQESVQPFEKKMES
jgi:alpha-beta hydrolase superfamily lysophospholipase